VIQTRAERQRVVRDNPKSIHRDTTISFAAMDQEWTGLCSRLGIEGFYVAVRGSIEDLSGPKLFFSEKAEKFVRAVLDLEPRSLALKLEAFVISGLDTTIPSALRQPRTLNKLISDCRTIIQDELDDILRDKKLASHIKMNYNNYEHSIVERYGVELVGWPSDLLPICNPSTIGGREISSNKTRQANGECVYKPRKKR
ncbi:hypothetical protein P692DRAFT_20723451, partial [Suillus brevipes Sb2]